MPGAASKQACVPAPAEAEAGRGSRLSQTLLAKQVGGPVIPGTTPTKPGTLRQQNEVISTIVLYSLTKTQYHVKFQAEVCLSRVGHSVRLDDRSLTDA